MKTVFAVVGDEIRFAEYLFAPATVHPDGVLRATDLRDADPGVRVAPPEVRLHSGETVYIPGGHDAVRHFCVDHGVPLVHRPDVWSALLQPFVDTEFEGYWEERTRAELQGWAFTPDEVAEIRERVAPAMLAYNANLWDWVHLGAYDLLQALSGTLTGPEHALSPVEYHAVYWWVMETAERSRGDAGPLEPDGDAPSPTPGAPAP